MSKLRRIATVVDEVGSVVIILSGYTILLIGIFTDRLDFWTAIPIIGAYTSASWFNARNRNR